jgi:uncharacterized protein (DUF302 family)
MKSLERGDFEISWEGRTVDAMVAEFQRERDVPGLAVAIVQAPYITRSVGFGLADRSTRALVGTRTAFHIGPMRAAFTGMATLQLVHDGKVRLEDAVRDHVSSAEFGGTLREALLANSRDLEAVVAAASGVGYKEFIRRRQFDPVGLTATFFGSDIPALRREALVPGGRHSAFLKQAEFINPVEPAVGIGKDGVAPVDPDAIYASAYDISVWDIGLAGDVLLPDAELRKILFQPRVGPDGTTIPTTGAWSFPGHPGLMIAGGSTNGFTSFLSRFTHPDDLVCVTILANREGLELSQLARRIAGAFVTRLGPPPGTADLRVQESPYSAKSTIDRLEAILRAAGVTIFTRIDHVVGATAAGQSLRPTEEIIFGNPKVGTDLLAANPPVVLDLPLRAAAWEHHGQTWLAATDPVEIAKKHHLDDLATHALRMRGALDAALLKATGPVEVP